MSRLCPPHLRPIVTDADWDRPRQLGRHPQLPPHLSGEPVMPHIIPDRIDTIAAAVLGGYLAARPANAEPPQGDQLHDLMRWALEAGQRYHALRAPHQAPPPPEKSLAEVILFADPVRPPVLRRGMETNVHPLAFPEDWTAVRVMGPIS
jgi:hypothetical protein